MFKVMLYTRVVLTVLVVVLIVRVIYRRVAAMLKSRGNTDIASLNDLRDQSDSAESDMLNMTVQNDGQQTDTERSDSFDDTSVGNNTSSDDDTIVEMSIVETEEGTILDRVVMHTDAQTGEAVIEEEIIVIAPEDTVPVDEVLAEEAAADAAIAPDLGVESADVEAVETAIEQPKTPIRSNYMVDTPVVDIEIPKDIEAGRNIAQGHSRDDIVRDKFEKHIAKIRYDAGILKQRNDILGYEKKLVEGLTLLPSDKVLQRQLADLYFQQGKFKKAHSLLKKILTDDPEDHNALWQLGEITLEEGNGEDAYVYFSKACSLCDDNPKYCLSLAQRYYDQEDYEQALPMMERVVKLRPKNIDYLVSLSHVQLKLGMREEAKQSLLRAQELDPMNITLKQYLKAL